MNDWRVGEIGGERKREERETGGGWEKERVKGRVETVVLVVGNEIAERRWYENFRGQGKVKGGGGGGGGGEMTKKELCGM